ncbi:MAG: YitT family protein [Chitinophagaceae bacterium]
MKSFVNHIILSIFPATKKLTRLNGKPLSSYEQAKAFRVLRVSVITAIKNILLISSGVFSASFGLKSFLLPNHFIDGGATGISLLITGLTGISISILLIVLNLPFIIIGARNISRDFAIKTALGITGLALAVAFVPYPILTNDKLLVAVFGGFFLGAGIGLSVRGGGVIDGTEVLAIFLSKRLGITIGDVILIVNILIFSIAAYILNLEIALYSVLTYLSASKTVDFIIEGIEEYTAVTIISPKHNEIRQMIVEVLGRGVTIYKGRRGFGKRGEAVTDMDIIYTVITRLEVSRMNSEIEKIDPFAFVVMSSVKDTKGGMIKKRPLKH